MSRYLNYEKSFIIAIKTNANFRLFPLIATPAHCITDCLTYNPISYSIWSFLVCTFGSGFPFHHGFVCFSKCVKRWHCLKAVIFCLLLLYFHCELSHIMYWAYDYILYRTFVPSTVGRVNIIVEICHNQLMVAGASMFNILFSSVSKQTVQPFPNSAAI